VPRSKQYPKSFAKTIIKEGASIGANATIIAGNTIDEFAFVGAGAVVTKNIGRNEIWVGNPAKKVGYIGNDNELLNLYLKSKKTGTQYYFKNYKLIKND
jgi:acetyltransferase-like isoleucine patch superfamily enzyme